MKETRDPISLHSPAVQLSPSWEAVLSDRSQTKNRARPSVIISNSGHASCSSSWHTLEVCGWIKYRWTGGGGGKEGGFSFSSFLQIVYQNRGVKFDHNQRPRVYLILWWYATTSHNLYISFNFLCKSKILKNITERLISYWGMTLHPSRYPNIVIRDLTSFSSSHSERCNHISSLSLSHDKRLHYILFVFLVSWLKTPCTNPPYYPRLMLSDAAISYLLSSSHDLRHHYIPLTTLI